MLPGHSNQEPPGGKARRRVYRRPGSSREAGKPMEHVKTGGPAKAKALLRLYLHSRKLRAAARDLAEALAESREVSSWPGDRLQVGAAVSEHVERLTRRLHVEIEAHRRLSALAR